MFSSEAVHRYEGQVDERRSCRRATLQWVVLVFFGGDQWGKLVDLSERGMCFQFEHPPALRQSINFTFEAMGCTAIPTEGHEGKVFGESIQATGRVKWTREFERTAGVEFVELSTKTRDLIRYWLSSGAPQQAPSPGQGFHQESTKKRSKTADRKTVPFAPTALSSFFLSLLLRPPCSMSLRLLRKNGPSSRSARSPLRRRIWMSLRLPTKNGLPGWNPRPRSPQRIWASLRSPLQNGLASPNPRIPLPRRRSRSRWRAARNGPWNPNPSPRLLRQVWTSPQPPRGAGLASPNPSLPTCRLHSMRLRFPTPSLNSRIPLRPRAWTSPQHASGTGVSNRDPSPPSPPLPRRSSIRVLLKGKPSGNPSLPYLPKRFRSSVLKHGKGSDKPWN